MRRGKAACLPVGPGADGPASSSGDIRRLRDLIEPFTLYLRDKVHLRPASIHTYASTLRDFVRACPMAPQQITRDMVTCYLADSPSSKVRCVRASVLRRWFAWAQAEGHIAVDPVPPPERREYVLSPEVESLIAGFAQHLRATRHVKASTATRYTGYVRRFLRWGPTSARDITDDLISQYMDQEENAAGRPRTVHAEILQQWRAWCDVSRSGAHEADPSS